MQDASALPRRRWVPLTGIFFICVVGSSCGEMCDDLWVASDSSRMILVRGGSFEMGDVFSEGAEDELPVHQVTVANFRLADSENTVGQFRRFITETGYRTSAEAPLDRAAQDSILTLAQSPGLTRAERLVLYDETLSFGGCAWWDADSHRFDYDDNFNWANPGYEQGEQHPAVCLSWDDAASYANWLSRAESLPPAYDVQTGELLDAEGVATTDVTRVKGYRLPTEAEWEYAAREGGWPRRFGNGKDTAHPDEAAFDASTGEYPFQVRGTLRRGASPVRSYQPNVLGIYDMAGNAWEWASDFLAPYSDLSQTNPYQTEGRGRAVRGGRWGGDASELRTAKRFLWQSNNRCNASGFRLARSGDV